MVLDTVTTMSNLTEKKCVPCEGGAKPLTQEEAAVLHADIPSWTVSDDVRSIQKTFVLTTFVEVIAFVNKIADLAEEERHHPDLFIHDYKKLTITLSTHAIGGLSVNDFIVAAKIDTL